MTDISTAPNRFAHWLRRLWPLYCLLAALATFGYALYDPYQIDGDAVAYMDIGDLIRAHNWHGVINGYWNPLYPALLALGHTLFHSNRYTELHAYYMVNFGIFLLEMLAVVAFTDALVQLRESRETAAPIVFLLDRYTVRYLAIALLVIASQRELSMGKVRPDALLTALLLFALAFLLRHLATSRPHYAALMGAALGFAYLAKSFAFLFTLLSVLALVAFRYFWQRHTPTRIVASAALVLTCFAIVAGPYIAALSKQKGRFDFGESGNLNYAWFVSGTEKMHLQQNEPALFGAAEVHLQHPDKQLLDSPPIFSYKQLPYGSYPDWFDTSFFNERVKAHINPRLQIIVTGQCLVRIVRYICNHPEPWALLIVLLLAGSRLDTKWRRSSNAFWLVPFLLGIASLCIYSMVNVEDRYLSAAFLLLLLPLFATLSISAQRSAAETITTDTLASAAIFLLALLVVGESARIVGELRRNLKVAQSPGGWYDPNIYRAAHALNDLGIGPGDTVACIGDMACLDTHYWARLAGVRILTEIYKPAEVPVYSFLVTMPNRDQAYDVVRHEGAKVLVGYFDPGLMTGTTPISSGWRELDHTPFYALPLNLPGEAAAAATENTHP